MSSCVASSLVPSFVLTELRAGLQRLRQYLGDLVRRQHHRSSSSSSDVPCFSYPFLRSIGPLRSPPSTTVLHPRHRRQHHRRYRYWHLELRRRLSNRWRRLYRPRHLQRHRFLLRRQRQQQRLAQLLKREEEEQHRRNRRWRRRRYCRTRAHRPAILLTREEEEAQEGRREARGEGEVGGEERLGELGRDGWGKVWGVQFPVGEASV